MTLSGANRYDLRRKFKKVDGHVKFDLKIVDELEDGALAHYVGNYSEYAFEKRQRLLKQQQMFQVQQRELQRLQGMVKAH